MGRFIVSDIKTATEKAAVMIAFDRGEKIQWRDLEKSEWAPSINPSWNWYDSDYRIAPKPAECWVWIHAGGSYGYGFNSEQEAKNFYPNIPGRAVLMREVIE